MNKNYLAVISTIGLVLFTALAFAVSAPDNKVSDNQPIVSNSAGEERSNDSLVTDYEQLSNTGPIEEISEDVVSKHQTKDDCWTIVNGNVFNITEYIPRHPGGSEILKACGVDSTTLFSHRETTDGEKIGSGTEHSSRAADQLVKYKIGVLQK